MNSLIFPLDTAAVYWLSNKRAVTYNTLLSGLVSLILIPIAWIRWVLPTPEGPNTKRGLNVLHLGLVAIASPIVSAILLLLLPQ